MRVDGHLAAHAARAYGLKLVRPTEPAGRESAVQPQSMRGPSASDSTGPVNSTTPSMSVNALEKASQLIAGHVPGPVDFSSGNVGTSGAGALPLYTRSADRVEAATAIQIGRQIDVQA